MKYLEQLKSKSGKEISLLVIEVAKAPKYTLVEVHGGFQGNKVAVAEANAKLIELLTTQNINYIAIDLSNNGTQPDQPFNEIRYSDRVQDVFTAVEFAVDKYKAKVILLGSSLGGCIVLNASLNNPSVSKLILNCAAVKPHECVQATINPDEFANWESNGIADVWRVPMAYDFYTDLMKNNALPIIPKLSTPILWFHGTADQVVPITQAYEARDANKFIELIEVKDGGHRFGDKMQPGEWEGKIIEFISS